MFRTHILGYWVIESVTNIKGANVSKGLSEKFPHLGKCFKKVEKIICCKWKINMKAKP